jgi:type IV secretory pathway VirB10-like protein
MNVAASAGVGNRSSALPLAATLALHLLLVLCWLGRTVPRPPDNVAPTVVSVLVPVPLPKPLRPLPLPVRPAAPTRPAATAAAPVQAPVTRPARAPEPEPVSTPIRVPDEPAPAPHTEAAEDMLRGARKDAGRIDRELRGGKSGVPREADTPMGRFRAGLAAAHIDRSHTSVTESYTGADGNTIYRIRQGDKVFCRVTGSSAPPMPGRTDGAILAGAGRFDNLGKSDTGGTINCPIGERDWVRR